MGNKTIDIKIVVDERAAQRSKEIIQELTRSLDGLAGAGRKAMQSAGVSGAGTGVAVRSGTITGIGGGVQGAAQRAGQAAGGIVQSVLGVKDPGAIRSLITDTKGGFQAISASVKTFVDQAENHVKRLQRAVQGLSTSMSGASMGGGGGSGGGWTLGRDFGTGGASGGSVSPLDHRPSDMQLLKAEARKTGRSPHQQGSFAGEFFAGSGIAHMVPGAGGIITAGNYLSQYAHGRMGTGAAVGGAAAGLAATALAFGSVEQDTRISNIRNYTQYHMQTPELKARMASPFLGMYHAGRRGDAAMGSAYMRTMSDPNIMASLNQTDLRRELTEKLTGHAGFSPTALLNYSKSGMGDVITRLTRDNPQLAGTISSIVLENARRNMTPEAMEQFNSAAQANRQTMSPRDAEMMNHIVGGAMGSVQLRRAGAIGIPKGREAMEYMRDMEAHLTSRGLTGGEYAGARIGLRSGAGTAYMNRIGGISALSMQAGGVQGLESIARLSGILGGSVGAGVSGLTKGFQGTVGRGGLDVTAGSELAHSILGRANSMSNFFTGDAGSQLYQGAAGLAYGEGSDVAQQMRRSGMIERGLSGMNAFTSGSHSGLSKMSSVLSSISASGGYSYFSQRLTQTPAEALTAAARGGAVPESLLSLLGNVEALPGESQSDAKTRVARTRISKFLGGVERAQFAESIPGMYESGSRTGDLVNRFKASGGSFGEFVQSETAGLKGTKRARAQESIARSMFSAIGPGGENADVLMSELVRYAPQLAGKGAYGAGPSGLEREGLQAQSGQLHRDAASLRTDVEGKKAAVHALGAISETGESTVNAISKIPAVAALDLRLENLASVLEKFATRMNRVIEKLPTDRGARQR